MISFISGFIIGAFSLLGYMIWRMLRSDGWDDSNVLNAVRLISHITIHPEDMEKLYYLDEEALAILDDYGIHPKAPFWYIAYDEFKTVVRSRPNA